MKAHVGVDSKTKIIHTAVATAANVADSAVLPDLLHGEETRVWGDQAYRGQTQVIRECSPQAQDCTHRRYRYKDLVDEVERAKTDEVDIAVEGRARVWGDEAEVRICEAALPRTEEECKPAVCGVRAGEPVPGAEKTAAPGTGIAPPRRWLIAGEPPKRGGCPGKNRLQTLSGMAEHSTASKTRAYSEFPLVWFRVVCLPGGNATTRSFVPEMSGFGNPIFGKLERAYSSVCRQGWPPAWALDSRQADRHIFRAYADSNIFPSHVTGSGGPQ